MARFKTNMQTIKKDQSAFETGGSGVNWFKLKDGKQVIRILPPWSEEGLFYKKVGLHRPPGRSMDKVVCPDYTFGTKNECPICKARAKVYNDLGKDASKDYNIQKRAYINVLDMKKADGEVYVLDTPASIMNPILNFMAEEESDQLVDPEKGYNILIVRKNEGGFTKYDVMIKPGEYNLESNDYDVDEILDGLNLLDKFVKEPDPDDFTEILEALNAKAYGEDEDEVGIDDEDDEEEEEVKPKSKSKKKLQSKKVVNDDPDDEDDEDEEDEDDEEDEEEVKPRKKANKVASKKRAPVVEEEDDEEEDEEEDEDEEDDEPVRKEKVKKARQVLKKKASRKSVVDDEDEVDTSLAGIDDDDFDTFDEDEQIPF